MRRSTGANQVRLRVVNPTSCTYGTCYTCETFVCATGTCTSAPGIMPTQCGPVDAGNGGG